MRPSKRGLCSEALLPRQCRLSNLLSESVVVASRQFLRCASVWFWVGLDLRLLLICFAWSP